MFLCVYTRVCITNTQYYVYIFICACMNYAKIYTYIPHFYYTDVSICMISNINI